MSLGSSAGLVLSVLLKELFSAQRSDIMWQVSVGHGVCACIDHRDRCTDTTMHIVRDTAQYMEWIGQEDLSLNVHVTKDDKGTITPNTKMLCK